MSKSLDHDDVVPGPGPARRGSAVAAAALAAVLLLGLGIGPAAATETVDPPRQGSGAETPHPEGVDAEVQERLAGVAEDLAEAITHGEITEEQATAFLLQLLRRLTC